MNKSIRIAGICGVLAPVIAFSCILLAIASYSDFSWFNNALSDLGIVWGFTATIFNSGLIISGSLFLFFSLGLFFFLRTNLGRTGALILSLACISLIAIGIFNESFKPIHYYVSVLFFVLMPISFFVLVPAFWIEKHIQLSVITLLSAFATAFPWVLQFTIKYAAGVAIPEFISGLAGSVWTLIICYQLIKKKLEL